MGKIEQKIKKLFLSLFLGGMVLLILVSAGTLWVMKRSGEHSVKEMAGQAVRTSADLLAEEMSAQTEKYTACFGDLMESRLEAVPQMMGIVARNVDQLYSRAGTEAGVSVPYGKDLQGTDPKLHWLLPEGTVYAGEIEKELELLGNIGPSFQRFDQENAQILRIYFTSSSGVNIGYDGDYEKKPDVFEGRETSWYQKAREQNGPVLSEAYTDTFVGQLTVTYSMPVVGGDGTFRGVLAADVLIDDLEEMIRNTNLEFDGYAMLVSKSGRMVAAEGLTAENADHLDLFLGSGSGRLLELIKAGEKQVGQAVIQGREKYVFFQAVEPSDWEVVIVLDKEEMEKAALQNASSLQKIEKESTEKSAKQFYLTCFLWILTAAAVLGTGYALSGKMARRLSRPITELCSDVKRFGEGELSYEAHIHTGDELEELSSAFSGMADSLKTYIGNLASLTAEKERIETELQVASQIQASMLPCIFPAFPEREELDIFASMEPAKEVGGDFYDFFLVDESHLCMMIADVSGKGIPAALFMVVSRTLLKDNVLSGRPLSEVFGRVNSQLCENNEAEMFVTAFLAVLDLDTGVSTYINAGHNPPLLRRRTGELEWLKSPSGFVLAGLDGMWYDEGTFTLTEGDLFFAYTDGVTETMNPAGELYREERLAAYIEKNWNERVTASAMVWSVREDLKAFAEDAVQADDITMLALKYLGKTAKSCLVVDAVSEELFRVQEFVNRRLREAGGTEYLQKKVQIAVEEIFTNIVQYAYEGEGSVEITFSVRQGKMRLSFADGGKPYNPLEHTDPDITLPAGQRPVGGLGIYLVKESMDEVRYEYRDGKNVLTVGAVV